MMHQQGTVLLHSASGPFKGACHGSVLIITNRNLNLVLTSCKLFEPFAPFRGIRRHTIFETHRSSAMVQGVWHCSSFATAIS